VGRVALESKFDPASRGSRTNAPEWRWWCRFRAETARPCDAFDPGVDHDTDMVWSSFVMYLYTATTVAPSTVDRYVHRVVGTLRLMRVPHVPPLSPEVLVTLRRGKQLPAPQHFKEPFTRDMVARVASDAAIPLATRAMVCLMFATGLRIGECSYPTRHVEPGDEGYVLRRSDAVFSSTGPSASVTVHLRRTKSDHTNAGRMVVAVSTAQLGGVGAVTCPVTMLRRLLETQAGDSSSPLFAFPDGRMVTRDDIDDVIKATATQLGLAPSDFSTHSLRVGGATHLASRGVPADTLRCWGRWQSEQGMVRYSRLGEERRTMIARAFGGDPRAGMP